MIREIKSAWCHTVTIIKLINSGVKSDGRCSRSHSPEEKAIRSFQANFRVHGLATSDPTCDLHMDPYLSILRIQQLSQDTCRSSPRSENGPHRSGEGAPSKDPKAAKTPTPGNGTRGNVAGQINMRPCKHLLNQAVGLMPTSLHFCAACSDVEELLTDPSKEGRIARSSCRISPFFLENYNVSALCMRNVCKRILMHCRAFLDGSFF